MTNTKHNPHFAFLLNGIRRVMQSYGLVDTELWDEKTIAAVNELETHEFLVGRPYSEGSSLWDYELTPAGRESLKSAEATPISYFIDRLGSGKVSNSGDGAVWVWMLRNAGVYSDYGTLPEVTPAVLHLLACGVNLSASEAPRDDVWTTFAGTFSSDDRRVGLRARAACVCGRAGPSSELSYSEQRRRGMDFDGYVRLRAEVDSIMALMRKVLG